MEKWSQIPPRVAGNQYQEIANQPELEVKLDD
jgi:hypothetical protein